MGLPQFRFSLTHQTIENGPVQFTNGDFAVSIFGWDNHCLSSSQPFNWTGGKAKADASASHYPNTCYFGQQRSGGWDQGKYVIDITASNTSVTAGATLPYESLLSVYGSQDNLSFEPITYTGSPSWTAGAGASTNRITFTTTKSYNYLFFGWSKVGPTSNYYVILSVDEIEIISAPRYHAISEPDGWSEAKLIQERHPEFHSPVEYFESGFIFYGNKGTDDGGIDFIKNVESNYGMAAIIKLHAEVTFDDSTYETVFDGLLDLYQLQETKDNKIEIPVIRESEWTQFISRRDTPVDLRSRVDLYGNPVDPVELVDVNLTSQTVRQTYFSEFDEPSEFNITTAGKYVQFGPDADVLSELDDIYHLYPAFNPDIPTYFFSPTYAGSYYFEFRIVISMSQAVAVPPGDIRNSFRTMSALWKLYFQINGQTPIQFNALDVEFSSPPSAGAGWTVYTFSGTYDLVVGDQVKVYGDEQANVYTIMTFWTKKGALSRDFGGGGSTTLYSNVTGFSSPSYFKVIGDTTYPSSTAQAFLIHDAFAGVIQRLIGRNAFYSEVLGGTQTNMRVYDEDGCYWANILLKGLHLRGYLFDNKPFFTSFNDLWKGADPMFNLSFGYDTVDGVQVFRLEKKDFWYDDSSTSTRIDNIREIVREYDNDRIFKKIQIGYNKWQAESASGLDDPQAKHTYATIL